MSKLIRLCFPSLITAVLSNGATKGRLSAMPLSHIYKNDRQRKTTLRSLARLLHSNQKQNPGYKSHPDLSWFVYFSADLVFLCLRWVLSDLKCTWFMDGIPGPAAMFTFPGSLAQICTAAIT